jgi:hypothetical protein
MLVSSFSTTSITSDQFNGFTRLIIRSYEFNMNDFLSLTAPLWVVVYITCKLYMYMKVNVTLNPFFVSDGQQRYCITVTKKGEWLSDSGKRCVTFNSIPHIESHGVWCQNVGHLGSFCNLDIYQLICAKYKKSGHPLKDLIRNWTMPPLLPIRSLANC